MFWILGWVFYGLVVGFVAKFLHSGEEEPQGFLGTVGIGIAGSYIGGFVNYLLGMGGNPISPSGFVMGIFGALALLFAYNLYLTKN